MTCESLVIRMTGCHGIEPSGWFQPRHEDIRVSRRKFKMIDIFERGKI
jgi:hypothetical protein